MFFEHVLDSKLVYREEVSEHFAVFDIFAVLCGHYGVEERDGVFGGYFLQLRLYLAYLQALLFTHKLLLILVNIPKRQLNQLLHITLISVEKVILLVVSNNSGHHYSHLHICLTAYFSRRWYHPTCHMNHLHDMVECVMLRFLFSMGL